MYLFWPPCLLQDPQASYDVNGNDPDPMPRYDATNENKYEKQTKKKSIPHLIREKIVTDT